ncbi:hypothetical protein BH11MYX2_BH11MYX2_35390 [soil metagenome]
MSFVTRFAAAASVLVLVGSAGCAEQPSAPEERDPNEGLLRDFLDGKYDDAGHPFNSKVVDASAVTGCGAAIDGGVQLKTGCAIQLPEGATGTDLIANIRYRVRSAPSSGRIVTFKAKDSGGADIGKGELKVSNLRAYDRWIDLPVSLSSASGQLHITVDVASGAKVDLQYVEVFSNNLGIVIAPGSGVLSETDRITIELPKAKGIEAIEANDVAIDARLTALLANGKATRTTTALRQLISVSVADLLPNREDVVELRVHSNGNTSRAQIRKTPAPCNFEGDPNGTKVLITGFQPFPADGWHENVAGVAVTALDASTLRGAQVMRLVLPVEYDRAPAEVTDAIARCHPQHVISFGQGGNDIALEQTAYNLQDTGELSGGAPDNRGLIRVAQPIDETAPAERPTLLPLDEIDSALQDIGEAPVRSTDPGRYICNNVMFNDIAQLAGHGRAGFIHLPYTTDFSDRTRWGRIAATAVQAVVDAF